MEAMGRGEDSKTAGKKRHKHLTRAMRDTLECLSRTGKMTQARMAEAAFLYYAMRLRQVPMPILVFRSWESETFLAWFRKHRPDAIVTCYLEVRTTLEAAGVRVPEDVGLALNWIPGGSPYAGIQQDFGAAGAAGFDLVEGQLHRHEHGIPSEPKTILLVGRWVEGTTVRSMPPSD